MRTDFFCLGLIMLIPSIMISFRPSQPIHLTTSTFDINYKYCVHGCNFNNNLFELKCHYLGNGNVTCTSFTPVYIDTKIKPVCRRNGDLHYEDCYIDYSLSAHHVPNGIGTHMQEITVPLTISSVVPASIEFRYIQIFISMISCFTLMMSIFI